MTLTEKLEEIKKRLEIIGVHGLGTESSRLLAVIEKLIAQRDFGYAKWAAAINDRTANGEACDKCDAELLALLNGDKKS